MKKLWRQTPNLLSGWRLISFPLLLYFVLAEKQNAFILLLSVNLVTDVLDGLIARLFKLQTEFGAKLDSIADLVTYIAAVTGMAKFFPAFLAQHKLELIWLLLTWLLPYIIALSRFRKIPHLHLYSVKVAGYLQGIFIFVFFNWQVEGILFWVMWAVSMLAFTEESMMLLRLKTLRPNAKGIYWMMKEKGRIE